MLWRSFGFDGPSMQMNRYWPVVGGCSLWSFKALLMTN